MIPSHSVEHPVRALTGAFIAVFAARGLGAQTASPVPFHFVRGDANGDGPRDLSDAVFTLTHLFLAGSEPPCLKTADGNDDGVLDLSDPIRLLSALFLAGPPPEPPYPSCGLDPTPDSLDCREHLPCEFETLASGYDRLRTVAGTGLLPDGVNGWEPRYEGGPAAEAELSNPHFAMSDGAGNLYIADKEAHAVRKVTLDGRIHTVAGTNSPGDDGDEPGLGKERRLSSPNGLWVRHDGTVYILDLDNSKVRRLAPDGILTTLFRVEGGIAVGRGLWVRDDEKLAYFSSSTELKRWSSERGVEVFAGGFSSLGNIVVDPSGRLVVTDRGLHQVFRLDAQGNATAVAGNGSITGGGDGAPALESALYGVRGVWLLPKSIGGGYLVGTHQGSQVWYIDTRGIIHLFLHGARRAYAGDGEHFLTPGPKVSEVRSVTVDAFGNVIVTENDAGFVRMVERRR